MPNLLFTLPEEWVNLVLDVHLTIRQRVLDVEFVLNTLTSNYDRSIRFTNVSAYQFLTERLVRGAGLIEAAYDQLVELSNDEVHQHAQIRSLADVGKITYVIYVGDVGLLVVTAERWSTPIPIGA